MTVRSRRLALPLSLRLAWRELRGGTQGFHVFIACLILGIGAIAAIGALSAAIDAGLKADGRALLGGDVEIRLAQRPATAPEIAVMRAAGTLSRSVEMRAMARPATPSAGTSTENRRRQTLIELKAVDGRYPLYGAIRLRPAMPIARALAARGGVFGAVVDAGLLTRLGVGIGGRLRIGDADVVVRAVIVAEPDRGAHVFTLGPRVIVARASLAATGLIRPGSLVRYYYRLRLPEGVDPGRWARGLEAAFPEAGWRVRDPGQAAPQLRRFVARLAQFLTLVGLSALLVGGLGVAVATRNHLDSRADTIATLKCLGAPGPLVFRTYLAQILALTAIGTGGGLILGASAPAIMVLLFGDSLPVPARIGIYPGPLALAAGFGLLTVLAFAVWPLARAREVPAARLFRALVAPPRRWPRPLYVVGIGLAVVALAALAVVSAHDRMLALWFVAAAALTLAVFRGAAWALARMAALAGRVRMLRRGHPGLRLALANLHRPGAPTASVVLSLGLGLTVLVAVAQIQGNLLRQIDKTLPRAAPSYFFIDIQTAQAKAFDAMVAGVPGARLLQRVPSLRGRIMRIAGVPVAKAKIAAHVRWAVRGDRGLTYAATPPPGSVVTRGRWWPADYAGPPLISLDQEVAMGMGIGVGDTLTVNVLGRDITARIANLRRIDWSTLGMNFVIVFAPGTLENAPHSAIATARTANPAAEAALLAAVTARFPNVSAIRVKDALDAIARVLGRIGGALRGTAGITVLAGILVLAGAIAAGHRRRVREAVLLKVLGATRAMVLRAYLVEYGLLGIATAALAAGLGSAAAWVVLTRIMGLDWVFLPGEAAATVLGATAITMIFGFVGVWRALGRKAAPVLRNP